MRSPSNRIVTGIKWKLLWENIVNFHCPLRHPPKSQSTEDPVTSLSLSSLELTLELTTSVYFNRTMNHLERIRTSLLYLPGQNPGGTHVHIQHLAPFLVHRRQLKSWIYECRRCQSHATMTASVLITEYDPMKKALCGKYGAPGIRISQRPEQTNVIPRSKTGCWVRSWPWVCLMLRLSTLNSHPMCLTASAWLPTWAAPHASSFSSRGCKLNKDYRAVSI